MFQNKGVGPLGHSEAVYVEEAELSWKPAATGIRAVSHPLSLWILSAHRLLFWTLPFPFPEVQLAPSFTWHRELPFQGPEVVVLASS